MDSDMTNGVSQSSDENFLPWWDSRRQLHISNTKGGEVRDPVVTISHVTPEEYPGSGSPGEKKSWNILHARNESIMWEYEPALRYIKEQPDAVPLRGVWTTPSQYKGERLTKSPYPLDSKGVLGQSYYRVNIRIEDVVFKCNGETIPLHHPNVLLYKVGDCLSATKQNSHSAKADRYKVVQLVAVLKNSPEHWEIKNCFFKKEDSSQWRELYKMEELSKETNLFFRFHPESQTWTTPSNPTSFYGQDHLPPCERYKHIYVQLLITDSLSTVGQEWDIVKKAY